MQMIWKLAVSTIVVAGLGLGSIGAMAVASSLTIDDEPGRVQTTAPVSIGGGDETDAATGTDASVPVPDTTPATTESPTPAATPVPTDPTSPVAVPPAGSQTIDDDNGEDSDDIDIDIDIDDDAGSGSGSSDDDD